MSLRDDLQEQVEAGAVVAIVGPGLSVAQLREEYDLERGGRGRAKKGGMTPPGGDRSAVEDETNSEVQGTFLGL